MTKFSGRLKSSFATPQESTGFMLVRAANAHQSVLRAALKPLDLTNMQAVLLMSLVWLPAEEPVTQRV